jgi:hypothetical protein
MRFVPQSPLTIGAQDQIPLCDLCGSAVNLFSYAFREEVLTISSIFTSDPKVSLRAFSRP